MEAQSIRHIAEELSIPEQKVSRTIALLDKEATVPFIARYRKEATGGLDEVAVRSIADSAEKLRKLEKRRDTILKSIETQGKLDPELRTRILSCYELRELEDIYLPYKPKRRTRATRAREQGLEGLADYLIAAAGSAHGSSAPADPTGSAARTALTGPAALEGAMDIIAERCSEVSELRSALRRLYTREALISSRVVKKKKEEGSKYRDYFDWSEKLAGCPAHRYLALRRGESEGVLRLDIAPDPDKALDIVQRSAVSALMQIDASGRQGANPLIDPPEASAADYVARAVKDAYERLIAPSLEKEFLAHAKEKADEESIRVFASNLRSLLLAPPLGRKRVLAVDPGYRTGCKVVTLNAQGELTGHTTIYPHPPQKRYEEARSELVRLLKHHRIEAAAVGNGTAGRETEKLLRAAVSAAAVRIPVFSVSEDGASIYSASETAREEFPDQDVTVRGAISIGRRLMDPLSELVKIDPKSLGVGQYQHDVNQTQLKKTLEEVVESCVNLVGVELNTAGVSILRHISGLGPKLAEAVVARRSAHGPYTSRGELLEVSGMGPKAFQQSAGFLRISGAGNPLDASAVHPESYRIVEQIAEDLGCTPAGLMSDPELRKRIEIDSYISEEVGRPTLEDIVKELAKPGRDPRDSVQEFSFREDIATIEELEEGMQLPGIVTNVTRFGAFVDIGIKQDGLIHISRMAERFVKDPSEIVSPGDHVLPKVVEVDRERGRISLSLIKEEDR